MSALSVSRCLLFCLPLIIVSCSKPTDQSSAPVINFITTAGHIYSNATVKRDSTVIIGFEVTKTNNDLIHYINIFCSYNSRPDTLIEQITLLPGTGTSYTHDNYITTRDSSGTEKYTFEANSFLGARSSINLTLTVP